MVKQSPGALEGLLTFQAQNITSSRSVEVGFDRSLPAGVVARSVANRMALPDDVDWQLRADDTAAYLREDRPIGEQLSPGARVTLTPRAHLGGGAGSERS